MASQTFEPNANSFAMAGLQSANRNLLRFTTAGSVDDGKSTLIGRLLYDSQSIYEDQLASVKNSRINRSSGPIDFSLLTDGLRAEREQGITIDVAYRYFTTPRRKFIIADTPGHEQYTRNMATGASTADAAIVLIDATKGVLPQSRRHTYIASLLGIRHVVAAINKMDLVSYSQQVFDHIASQYLQIADQLGLPDVYLVPISALEGDNVVRRSSRMKWFDGDPLLKHLEDLPDEAGHSGAVRFPVQYVIRPNQTFRGFAGQLASGRLTVGETVIALPSGTQSRVKSIVTFENDELCEAHSGQAITLTLEDELDISRGDMLVTGNDPPAVSKRLQARLVWMHSDPLDPAKLYVLKHSTRTVRARVSRIRHRVDINTFAQNAARTLDMNDIASVEIESTLPLFCDPYLKIRATGSFILMDPISNATVAAGMIDHALDGAPVAVARPTSITEQERRERFGHGCAAVVVMNRPQVAALVERTLFSEGWNAIFVDVAKSTATELLIIAETLRRSGAVGIFSAKSRQQRTRLSTVFVQSTFEARESDDSDLALAAHLVDQLNRWREAGFARRRVNHEPE